MAFRLSRGLSAGMGFGGICGAVTGSFLVLGLWVGDAQEEKVARYRTYDLVRDFISRFEQKRGTIQCRELLDGVNLGTPEGRKEAEQKKLFTQVCPGYVEDAALILEEMMSGQGR
jgi:C_GCAxxG_C_C family probable redox protein